MAKTQQLSLHDRYALARAFCGKPINGLTVNNPVVQGLLETLDWSSAKDLNFARQLFKDDIAAILAVDPNMPPPVERKTEIPIPPLPDYARPTPEALKAAKSASRWVDHFVEWAVGRSPLTPRLFLEAGALWVLATITARRAYAMFHAPIYPNLWVLWAATTTSYAKSTGMSCVGDMISKTCPHLLITLNASPEALLTEMAGKLPPNMNELPEREQQLVRRSRQYAAQRGALIDEISSLFGSVRKDYMQGLMELLLKAYDGAERYTYTTRQDGLIVAERLGLGILGATTPAAIARYVTTDQWENGQMARYALLSPEGHELYKLGKYSPPPEDMMEILRRLDTRLPQPPDPMQTDAEPYEPVQAKMEDAVLEGFDQYSKAMYELVRTGDLDERLKGNYGRMATQAAKVALVLALADWMGQAEGNPLFIRGNHWTRAVQIAESWRESAHRTLEIVNETADSKGQERIFNTLKRSPSGLTLREIMRSCNMQIKMTDSCLRVLIESGDVETVPGIGGNGRPITLYRVVS